MHLSEHFDRLRAVDNKIEWHTSVLKTLREADYYRQNPISQQVETEKEEGKLYSAYLEKDALLAECFYAVGKERKKNKKLVR